MTTRRTFLDIHVLQSVPPSNINRDDTGSPKTAIYGGVRRARVSSQAWKRATRKDFEDSLDKTDLGVRTKRVLELVADEIAAQDPNKAERAVEIGTAVLKAAGIKLSKPRNGEIDEAGYLIFVSHLQIGALAAAGLAADEEGTLETLDKKTVGRIIKDQNSIDVSLFGRMVAESPDYNVDAAAQVAHAISVHAVDNEFDYFTAVDDHKAADSDEDAGAGMIGTVEFNSSTLYRYATVDVEALERNLGSAEATERAVQAFLQSFVRSMPTGKQNTFANRTLPDAVVVFARQDQPISLVGAFEDAITATEDASRLTASAARLADYAGDITASYGSSPEHGWVVGVGSRVDSLNAVGTRVAFDKLLIGVGDYVASRLAGQA